MASGPAITTGGGSSASRPPSILFGNNAKSSNFSSHSRAVLLDIMKKAGVHTVTITSTYRDAADQARVMVNNIEKKGVASQKRLYRGKPGSRVVDFYEREKAAIADAEKRGIDTGLATSFARQRHLVAAVERQISAVGQEKVSNHSGLQAILNVFDVDPQSLIPHHYDLFLAAAQAEPRVTRLLWPKKDPAFHFEIAQPGDFPIDPFTATLA